MKMPWDKLRQKQTWEVRPYKAHWDDWELCQPMAELAQEIVPQICFVSQFLSCILSMLAKVMPWRQSLPELGKRGIGVGKAARSFSFKCFRLYFQIKIICKTQSRCIVIDTSELLRKGISESQAQKLACLMSHDIKQFPWKNKMKTSSYFITFSGVISKVIM